MENMIADWHTVRGCALPSYVLASAAASVHAAKRTSGARVMAEPKFGAGRRTWSPPIT